MDLVNDNKGQGGLTGLFQFALMFLILSAVWFTIAAEIITNVIAPVLGVQQYGAIGLLLFRLGAFVVWSAILPLAIMQALKGQQVEV